MYSSYWNIELNKSWMPQGLRRSLVSAQLISQATVNFFDDLHQRASEVMKLLDKNNINTVDQLQKFEKEFKVKRQKWLTYIQPISKCLQEAKISLFLFVAGRGT